MLLYNRNRYLKIFSISYYYNVKGGENLGPLLNIFKRKKDSIEDRLRSIKEGNKEEREKFISEYTPFVIKTITKVTNRYIEVENNDEYSIGLEAFNEAIDRYEFKKGSFIKYAETVIRSRIYDYVRKTKKSDEVLSINGKKEESFEIKNSLQDKDFTDSYDMKDQILKFQSGLKKFNITISELVEDSPKHIDTRLNAINIAKVIAEDEEIKEEFYRKKVLPAKKIMERIDVSRKVLKVNRKFIIATVLILDSELDLLKNYISQVEGRQQIGI
ncbi:MAG: polymerase sigma factor [Candidatus Petromonas sp.]|jgi:RNA polymerase sigma factor|nr:polymerase sigma factor [Candidatus Petromonas sp.]